MARSILKTGNTILRTAGKIFQVGDVREPALDLNPELLNLANNAPVMQWTDFSGRKNHAIQTTAARQPLFRTNQINGLPAIQFDGTDDYFDMLTAVDAKTVFAVVRSTKLAAGGTLFSNGVITANNLVYFNGGDSRSASTSNSSWFYAQSTFPNDFFGTQNNLNRIYVNGNGVAPIENALRTSVFSLITMDVARSAPQSNISMIGVAQPANGQVSLQAFFWGLFARLIVYDYRLPSIERRAKEQELMTKYGL